MCLSAQDDGIDRCQERSGAVGLSGNALVCVNGTTPGGFPLRTTAGAGADVAVIGGGRQPGWCWRGGCWLRRFACCFGFVSQDRQHSRAKTMA